MIELDQTAMAEAMNKKHLLKKSDVKHIENLLAMIYDDIQELKAEVQELKASKKSVKKEG